MRGPTTLALALSAGLCLWCAACEVQEEEGQAVVAPEWSWPGPNDTVYAPSSALEVSPPCTATCPEGTAIVQVTTAEDVSEAIDGGGFYFVEATCESLCAPSRLCHPPNVPAVTEAGFACQALEGFVSFPDDAQTDLGWGHVWNPALHQPEEAP